MVLQFMCSIQLRARWFFKEKATYHRAFGVQQLENSYNLNDDSNEEQACGAPTCKGYDATLIARVRTAEIGR